MFLTAVTQRDRLFDVAMHWLNGRVGPGDGRFLTEAFLLDHAITAPLVARFFLEVTALLGSGDTRVNRLRTKDGVRRQIIAGWRTPSQRALELFALYRSREETFFPATPVDLLAMTRGDGELVAMMRFKRLQRIAEKAARRVVDRVDHEVMRRLGCVGGHETRTSARDLSHELVAATEQEVCRDYGTGAIAFTHQELRVGDVIGAKLIGNEQNLARIETAISSHSEVVSVHRSEHRGVYNDVQLEVELRCPSAGTTVDRLRAGDWMAARERGLDPESLRRNIPSYVEGGAQSFFIEILLTTWPELVESEFGRALHEERIVRMRFNPRYTGQLGTTVALATMYLMLVAISPVTVIDELPFRMSGRYLPESLVASVAELFGLSFARSPFWIPEPSDVRSDWHVS